MSRPVPEVRIIWHDSGAMTANDQWTHTHKVMAEASTGTVRTTGMLLKLDDKVAVVGLSYDEGYDNWFGAQVIQRKSIEKITLLRARRDFGPDELDSVPTGMVDIA